jgi:transposase
VSICNRIEQAELGYWVHYAAFDFNNRRQLASYVGYAPSPFQNVTHDQGLSKAANRKGRTTGIELAWLWLRYQPDSDLSAWFRAGSLGSRRWKDKVAETIPIAHLRCLIAWADALLHAAQLHGHRGNNDKR